MALKALENQPIAGLARPYYKSPVVTLRLSFLYLTTFMVVGIILPYWPVWLKARGMDASDIGVLLSAAMWVKVVGNPLVAQIADRSGRRRQLLLLLAVGSLGCYALYAVAHGFWALLAVTLLSGAVFSALFPVSENLALLTAHAHRGDYGRIRLWGSLSFIVTSAWAGRFLVGQPEEMILWLTLGGLALVVVAALLLPADPDMPRHAYRLPLRSLMAQPTFRLFLAAAALVQVSHAVYYGFATLHWRAVGLPGDTIGWLWAEGVVAEIVLFAFGDKVVRCVGPARLLMIGALGGVLRWTVLGVSDDLMVLISVQGLHAATFGASHLAAMHFIARAVPPHASAAAQGLYSAVAMGVAFGLAMLTAGILFEAVGQHAYFAMAGLCAMGGAAAWLLARRWDGGTVCF